MRRALLGTALLSTVLVASPAYAWFDGGHMEIAYLGYMKLNPTARAAADTLLMRNPDYCSWVLGTPDNLKGAVAFMQASVWADKIKDRSDYTNDLPTGATPGTDTGGYTDKNMHKYWHFRDMGFSTDGTNVPGPDPANIDTQLKAFIADIKSGSGQSADVRSYELTWFLHLIGDAHQPMHTISRFAKTDQKPGGDIGGNTEVVVPATGLETALHYYWDDMFGGYVTPVGAINDIKYTTHLDKVEVNAAEAGNLDPDHWLDVSRKLAYDFGYAEPVLSTPVDPTTHVEKVRLTDDYEMNAYKKGYEQAGLAYSRLGNVLNQQLTGNEDPLDPKCGASK